MEELWHAVLGAMDEEAREYGEEHAASHFANVWMPRISASIQRGNALAVIHRCRRDRAAMGRSTGGRRPHYHDDSY